MINRAFQSFSEFLDYAETPHPNDHVPGWKNSSEHFRPTFTGVSTKEEAFSLCRGGHPKGTQAMMEVLAELKTAISMPCEQYNFVPGIEGCAPDVQAFIQGLPDDMLFMEPIEIEAPPSYLRVQMELAYASSYSEELIRLAGSVIFAAQEALKAQGCNLEIIITFTLSELQCSFPLPSNIDLDTFAFIYTHPAMLRVIFFSVEEHEPKAIRQQIGIYYGGGGYGHPELRRLPDMDAFLPMKTVISQVSNLVSAKDMFNRLVENKFNL